MANGIVHITRGRDWPLANPWLWLAVGFGLVLWSWLWVLTFGEISSDYRVIVLAVGLLASSVGLWLRYRDRQSIYLCAWAAPLGLIVQRGLGAVFSLVGLASTGLMIYSWTPGAIGLAAAPAFLVFLTLAPPSYYAARRCFQMRVPEDSPREIAEEIALAFLVLAGTLFVGGFALYLGSSPLRDFGSAWYSSAGPNWSLPDSELAKDWDTIRIFLRVLGVVCFYSAVLVVVSPGLRRATLSLLFVLHFMGISTACLAAPPSPWIVTQAWVRVFRPYLEFVYLVNAYHFYAPDPNASTHLWFRLIYKDGEGQKHGWWYKIPHVDEKGRIHHTVDLEYVRFLAMTESVASSATLPPPFLVDNFGQTIPHPLYQRRLHLLPLRAAQPDNVPWPRIPLHPRFSQMQQVSIPSEDAKRRIASFTRFVARKYRIHPEHPEWTFESVKLYRVLHEIPNIELLVNDIPPNDPQLYMAYFMGNFDDAGKLIPDEDPYLYWLLPSLRDTDMDPNSGIKDYCRRHAGDSKWYRSPGETPGERRWEERLGP